MYMNLSAWSVAFNPGEGRMRIRQVDHLLDLIELYAQGKAPLTLTALAQALGMPKSSTFNLIETLVARGFLYEIGPRRGYYPTRRLFDLSRAVMEGDRLLESIHGELVRLARETGETALLAARDHGEVVYVDVVESTALIRYFAQIGDRRPIYTTSSGKAILTSYPRPERDRIVSSLSFVAHQPTTSTCAAELAANLEQAILRGWCEDHAEFTPDVMGLGVPVVGAERRFGLAVAGPLYRLRGRRRQLAATLQGAARTIEAKLARS